MKYIKFFTILLISAVNLAAYANTAALNSAEVIMQLEQSSTVYALQLKATREYATSHDYIEVDLGTHTLNNSNDRYRRLELVFKPSSHESLETYPFIRVTVYYIEPSHYQQTVGVKSVNFYRFESMVDLFDSGGRSH